ncbi:MAG: metalloregulator ArsR/SmtB family transcription factor [Candidatus Levybacteria bacterium]|nr:metalloregulator ArsR/SmtB family transcription factor [Candidatus Levybacteria bacterium]
MSRQIVGVFKALSDETRIDILRHLLGKKEIACKELLSNFSLSQPTLSHHFNKLIDAKILNERKEGVSHIYSINYQYLKELGIDIQKIVAQSA